MHAILFFQTNSNKLLYASGFIFMGATEEMMVLLSGYHVTHVSYVLLLYSAAFLIFLFVCVLLNIYANATWPLGPAITLKRVRKANGRTPPGLSKLNGYAKEEQRVKDVEEFELDGLMSADDIDLPESSDSGSNRGRKQTEHV
jgi:hypothetical protein